MQTIIKNFTKENDLIYDPFMGLGTTAIVAKSMNRQYIGSEISKEYIELAMKRINSETALPLFEKETAKQQKLFIC